MELLLLASVQQNTHLVGRLTLASIQIVHISKYMLASPIGAQLLYLVGYDGLNCIVLTRVISWTGMKVLKHDGSQWKGPGQDEILLRGIAVVRERAK